MKNTFESQKDSLALALTKPAMRLGVPMTALYSSMLACLLGWMMYQAITGDTSFLGIFIFLMIWSCVYSILFYFTFNDPFGLSIAWLNFSTFHKPQTYSFWSNTDSYAP